MTTISFDVPEDTLLSMSRSPEEFAKAVRLAAAIYWYHRGEISQERAARIAGLDRTDFLLVLANAGIDTVVIDLDDLKRELERG